MYLQNRVHLADCITQPGIDYNLSLKLGIIDKILDINFFQKTLPEDIETVSVSLWLKA